MKKITALVLVGSMALAFCACAPKDEKVTESTSGQSQESTTEAASGGTSETSPAGARWIDSNRCIVNGHEIVIGQSTVQELADSCYIVVHDASADPTGDQLQSQDYTLDTVVSQADMNVMR